MLITDRDAFISVSGTAKKDYIDRKISTDLEKIIDERHTISLGKGSTVTLHSDEEDGENIYSSQVISPILAEGDSIGAVIILSKEKDKILGEVEEKLAEAAATFLGKQMEQ